MTTIAAIIAIVVQIGALVFIAGKFANQISNLNDKARQNDIDKRVLEDEFNSKLNALEDKNEKQFERIWDRMEKNVQDYFANVTKEKDDRRAALHDLRNTVLTPMASTINRLQEQVNNLAELKPLVASIPRLEERLKATIDRLEEVAAELEERRKMDRRI